MLEVSLLAVMFIQYSYYTLKSQLDVKHWLIVL